MILFGIGISYGVRNIRISFVSKFILFFVSCFVSFLSVFFGKFLTSILSDFFVNFISSFILFFIGFVILIKCFFDKSSLDDSYFDFNHSNIIDPKEAFFLSFALSLDSFGIGISSSLIGVNPLFFVFCIAVFQFIFLNFGFFLGFKIKKLDIVSDKFCSFVSAFLLFAIRFFSTFLAFIFVFLLLIC